MIVYGANVAAWVYEPLGGAYNDNSIGIGWVNSEGMVVAGMAVEGYNGHNCYVHLRHDAPAGREFWYGIADWCFNHMQCKRITAPVIAANTKAIRLLEHIGFTLEAVMKSAAYDGTDLHLMVLWKDDCRMLKWKRD